MNSKVVFPTLYNHTQLVCSLCGEDRKGLVGANFITGCESQKDSGSALKDIHEGYGTSSIYGNARRLKSLSKAGSIPDHPANFGRLAQRIAERLALRSQEVGGSNPSSPASFGWGACFMTRPSGRTTPNRQFMDRCRMEDGSRSKPCGFGLNIPLFANLRLEMKRSIDERA